MSFKKKLRVTPSKVLMYWDNYWAIMMNHHNLFEFFFFWGLNYIRIIIFLDFGYLIYFFMICFSFDFINLC